MASAQKRTHARVSREERDTRPRAPGGRQSKTTCIDSSGPPRRPFQKNSPTAPELRLPPGVNAAPELLPSPALETSSGGPALLQLELLSRLVQHWVFGSSKGAVHTARVESIIQGLPHCRRSRTHRHNTHITLLTHKHLFLLPLQHMQTPLSYSPAGAAEQQWVPTGRAVWNHHAFLSRPSAGNRCVSATNLGVQSLSEAPLKHLFTRQRKGPETLYRG